MQKADIVLPVCHGLSSVIDCVESIVEYTHTGSYTLFLVDDHSDRRVREYLYGFSEGKPHILVCRHSGDKGYLSSCLFGMGLGSAPYMVLLNSGEVLTPDWLDRLIACAESRPGIASVRPLTNAVSITRLPMFPGASFQDMDAYLRRHFRGEIADTIPEIGSCMLLRRAMMNAYGLSHGAGAFKKTDSGLMPATAGYRTIAACDVYVYQKEHASYAHECDSCGKSQPVSEYRWLAECSRQYREIRRKDILNSIGSRFMGQKHWDPMPVVWQTARKMQTCLNEKRFFSLLAEGLQGLMQLPLSERRLPSAGFVQELTRPHRLRVTYILQNMVIAGGVLSVIQIVNELILLGIEARIVTLFKDPGVYEWTRLYTEPIVYRNQQEMLEHFPPTDIAVATLWTTAPLVDQLVRKGKAGAGAYFIQDYEPWFFPESDKDSRQRVQRTFSMIPNRIVKSGWLAGMLAADGHDTCQILLGMDLGQFYPRDVDRSRPVILAMVRPKTPRRGFVPTIAALAKVKKLMPQVEIVLFGDRFLGAHSIPFDFRDEGVVMNQNRLAELYSEAHVFLDGSDFQGFGRCGLEAMACGAACVLTGAGGVMEYAVHGENALIVPPKQPERFAEAMLTLLRSPLLQAHLIEGGKRTVLRFCHKREARQTRDLFLSLAAQSGLNPEPEDDLQ